MSQISIDDVADYLDGWHRYDGYGMCLCPYHDDSSPSCSVSNKGFICLSASCGEKGSLEKLYKHVSGHIVIHTRSYNSAGKIWGRWHEKFGSIDKIAKLAHTEIIRSPDLAEFFYKRKAENFIESGMFGYLDGYFTFPIRNYYNEIMGMVIRASTTIQTKENRYSVYPNCPVKLYSVDWRKVSKDESVYVPFGILDSITLREAEYASLTGISGQELNHRNLEHIRKPIFIIPDKGEERKALELQVLLGWRGKTLLIDWPESMKDLNEVHQSFGTDKVKELIEKSKRRYEV